MNSPVSEHPPVPIALPLTVSRHRLRFIAQEPLRLPAYAGSAWRGAFGHALKRLVCVTREPRCPDCLLYRSCTYPCLFETPPDPAVALLLAATRLRWRDWSRYSSRQWTAVPMGGLVGEIELNGLGLEPFWPWLWLGQWTHAGKGAVMGLGGYRVVIP